MLGSQSQLFTKCLAVLLADATDGANVVDLFFLFPPALTHSIRCLMSKQPNHNPRFTLSQNVKNASPAI